MHTDYYAILGLTHSATAEDVRLAYERLRQAFGPDAAAAQRLEEVKVAYEVLSDANRRTLYDLESMERDLEARGRELDADLFGPPSTVVDPDSAQSTASFEEELASVLAELSVLQNSTLSSLGRYSPRGIVDRRRERDDATREGARLSLRAPSLDAPAKALSGGNQQDRKSTRLNSSH